MQTGTYYNLCYRLSGKCHLSSCWVSLWFLLRAYLWTCAYAHTLSGNGEEGYPPNRNYLLEGGAVVVQASPARRCSRDPSVSVCQHHIVVRGCVWLQWIFFFWGLFQCVCPFPDGWFMSGPAHTALSDQKFLTKKLHDTCAPPFLFTQSCPERPFVCLFLGMKKAFKGNALPVWKRWNKNGSSTERHQNWRVQKLFWAVEKSLNGCIASNGEHFQGGWSSNI